MTKRFCDGCGIEIPPADRYYDVLLNVKISADPDDQDPKATLFQDFCYACTKSGKALTQLMAKYEEL